MARTDYHKETPKAVRMPDGLKVYVKEAAAADGLTENAFIVAAIEAHLNRHGPEAEGRPQGYHTKPLLTCRVPAESLAWARAEAKRLGQPFGDFIESLIADRRAAVAGQMDNHAAEVPDA